MSDFKKALRKKQCNNLSTALRDQTNQKDIRHIVQSTEVRNNIININLQWGEQVFDTLPILQVFLLTKHVEVCNFYHRYTSTVRDGI